MTDLREIHWIAFAGYRRIADGDPERVARAVKRCMDAGPSAQILVFDRVTAQPVELDLRGTENDVVDRLASLQPGSAHVPEAPESPTGGVEGSSARPARGRPRLGVVAREVTLLPRHWAWLGRQPGGASAALRRLVDRARSEGDEPERLRQAQEAAYRFMSSLAGDLPHFEEAIRAFYARDALRFEALVRAWPPDVAAHALEMATEPLGMPW